MGIEMRAIIKKDISGITANKRMFTALLIVPLVLMVFLPSLFILILHFAPDEMGDLEKLLDMIPHGTGGGDLNTMVIILLLDYMLPVFFLIVPVMTSSIMAASSFIGEKEKRTLETLLYSPLSLRQIFQAKVMAAFLLSMLVSLVSFVIMLLVVEIEVYITIGSLILLGIQWLFILLLVSPSITMIAITLIVRMSAKAQSVEEAQQGAVFLLLPILMLLVGQFTGVLMLNIWILFGLGLICGILAFVLLKKCMRRFQYELLLK